jgi:hypothetical protein
MDERKSPAKKSNVRRVQRVVRNIENIFIIGIFFSVQDYQLNLMKLATITYFTGKDKRCKRTLGKRMLPD